MNDGKAESEQKLSDAERQITDGETQISQAKETLVSGKSQMEDARAKIRAKQQELDEAKKHIKWPSTAGAGEKQYEQGKAAYRFAVCRSTGTDPDRRTGVGCIQNRT